MKNAEKTNPTQSDTSIGFVCFIALITEKGGVYHAHEPK